MDFTDEEIHEEILLHLYLEGKARQAELYYLEQFVLSEIPDRVKCSCCERLIRKEDKFMIYHNADCAKRHVGVLMWRERRECLTAIKVRLRECDIDGNTLERSNEPLVDDGT